MCTQSSWAQCRTSTVLQATRERRRPAPCATGLWSATAETAQRDRGLVALCYHNITRASSCGISTPVSPSSATAGGPSSHSSEDELRSSSPTLCSTPPTCATRGLERQPSSRFSSGCSPKSRARSRAPVQPPRRQRAHSFATRAWSSGCSGLRGDHRAKSRDTRMHRCPHGCTVGRQAA
jgi:hypothetical protein